MTLGKTPSHEDLFRSSTDFCGERLSPISIYVLLHREGHRLFPDEEFADLFVDVGRNSVPPRIVATVMVLQRIDGLSDREAVERFAFDLRWKYAAGGLDFAYPGFVHTVLVDMRERLRRSKRPDRIFEAALGVAKSAGLIGRKRVIDSTALYDAVATQDTVTLIRSAIRALLQVAGDALAAELRGVLKRDDDYTSAGKPVCDWDDKAAREELIDALARDAYAVLSSLDGRELAPEIKQAAALVATVVGQDLEQREDGVFRIARRVAKDRVISVVDPEARHGHKTAARGFDGYKGHIALDPDSEIITATAVTSGNAGDASVATELLSDVIEPSRSLSEPKAAPEVTAELPGVSGELAPPSEPARAEVYGDSSYGTAELVDRIEGSGAEANVKVQGPSAAEGQFTKDAFDIDLQARAVTCPAQHTVPIEPTKDGGGLAEFGLLCAGCPLRSQCTESKEGRTVRVHPREATLQRSRERQKDPAWRQRYRSTRPKVERKIGHLMRRKHGGRRARVRGCRRVGQDFALLAAATNLKRLAALGVRSTGSTWQRRVQ